jgi:orotate phosphoribosyltransferase-like protein
MLIVHAMCAYASYGEEIASWRQSDFNVNKLVKSIKGSEFKGYADLKDVDGKWRRIASGNRVEAISLFARWASRRIKDEGLGEIALVPVPSSDCTSYEDSTLPLTLARAIKSEHGNSVSVGPWLRFVKKMQKSHDGGTRNQSVFEENLRVSHLATSASRVVLIDDVKTTGAHLRACANKLREKSIQIDLAIVVASTVWAQHPDPFCVDTENIEIPFSSDDEPHL